MPRVVPVVLCLLAACIPGGTPPDAVTEDLSTVTALKQDLRSIMTAQERRFAATGTYAATLELLGGSEPVPLPSGGTVQMIGAPNSFTTAISKSIGPGVLVQCRVAVGNGKENDGLIECE